jgi:hypothetical protein
MAKIGAHGRRRRSRRYDPDMKTIALITLVAACAAQPGDDYPIQPGGGNPVASGGPGGMATVAGRACIVTDPRALGACSSSSAAGLTVTLGGAAATTAADGSFTLPAASDASAMVGVTGAGIMPTQMVASAAMSIPVLRADLFSQMMAANGITLEAGSGSILGSVLRGTAPATGIAVTSTPSPAFGPLFDGTTPTAWTLDATGARGVVWIPGVAVGPTQLTFRDLASSGETTVDGVQVVNGGITILDAVLP